VKPSLSITPATLLALLLLPGCAAVGPDYVAPEPATPATWQGAAAAKVTVVRTAPDNLASWWRQLDDPTLTGLIERALQNSLDVRTAQAKLREARARRALAGANLFPTVTASATANGHGFGHGHANPKQRRNRRRHDTQFIQRWLRRQLGAGRVRRTST